jgi:hypothetical protein
VGSAGSRAASLAGEVALGAGATVVLVTGSGMGGFGSAPTIVHAENMPQAAFPAAPSLGAAPGVDSGSVTAGSVARIRSDADGGDGAPIVIAEAPTGELLVDMPPAPTGSSSLPTFPQPPLPSHPGHTLVQAVGQQPAAAMTVVVAGVTAQAVAQSLPALPLISR